MGEKLKKRLPTVGCKIWWKGAIPAFTKEIRGDCINEIHLVVCWIELRAICLSIVSIIIWKEAIYHNIASSKLCILNILGTGRVESRILTSHEKLTVHFSKSKLYSTLKIIIAPQKFKKFLKKNCTYSWLWYLRICENSLISKFWRNSASILLCETSNVVQLSFQSAIWHTKRHKIQSFMLKIHCCLLYIRLNCVNTH